MPNVVIIGAGPAGLGLAQALLNHKPALPADVNVVVIDRRDYYWHIIAGLRAPVDTEVAQQATIPYDRVFANTANARIVRASATRIDDSAVYTDHPGADAKIDYAYLVLAMGSTWSKELNLPQARDEALKKLSEQGAQLAAARKIVIIGGGAVGVELAGEIATKYSGQKQKHVTLIHRGTQLLNDVYPDKLRERLRKQLEAIGVTVKLNTSLDANAEAGEIVLADGEKLTCDLVYQTTGGRPNVELLKEYDAAALAENGYVAVDKSFRIKGHPKLFALGDLADLPEQRQAAKIPGHVSVAALNIISLLKEGKVYSEYEGQKELIIVTVGSKGGAGWVMGVNIGSFFSSMIKSKGLFISKTRKQLGY